MKPFGLRAVIIFTLSGFGQAWAGPNTTDVMVGNRKVVVAAPAGACVYDRNNPADAQVLSVLEKANQSYNKVVLAFSDCKDLEAARQGKAQPATADYGQILSPLAATDFERLTRAEFVGAMADYFRKNTGIFEEKRETIRDVIDSVSHGTVKMGTTRMLGVMNSDPNFVQVGLIQTVQASDKTMVFAGIVTTTKLGVPVTVNLYHPYTDDASVQALAGRAAAYARELIALNPETASPAAAPPQAAPNGGRAISLAAIVVGLITVAAAMRYARRRRA